MMFAVIIGTPFLIGRAYERHQWAEPIAKLQASSAHNSAVLDTIRYYRCSKSAAAEALLQYEPAIVVVCEVSNTWAPDTQRRIICDLPAQQWQMHMLAHEQYSVC